MALSDEKYIRFTTFKRDGTAVSTPTWVVALDGGKVGFTLRRRQARSSG